MVLYGIAARRGLRMCAGVVALIVVGLLVAAPGASAVVLKQYRIPGGGLAEAIVSGPDGALWFTEPGADRIGRVTTSGTFSGYRVALGSHPLGIAAGPDGALWFTEEAAGRIGRVTTTGALSEYPATPGSHPVSITAGPDGALWFTDSSNRIGRVTLDGTISEYALPTLNAQPLGITAGSDGALWFTEPGVYPGGRIGRIDPATNSITEFCGGPHCAGMPEGITAGPDGALWFTEQLTNKIGRITTTGALTEFDGPPLPFGITVGPDRALWYTSFGMPLPGAPTSPGVIGRLTTGGVRQDLPLVPFTGESPNDITTGPDGAIWITMSQAGFHGDLITRVLALGRGIPRHAKTEEVSG